MVQSATDLSVVSLCLFRKAKRKSIRSTDASDTKVMSQAPALTCELLIALAYR